MLEVADVGVRFGGVVALDGLSFSIDDGHICALIGPNGAGKTTLFNVVSRLYEPSQGSVRFDGLELLALSPHRIAALGIARTFQNLALVPGLSVLDNVRIGAHARTSGGFWGRRRGWPSVQPSAGSVRTPWANSIDSGSRRWPTARAQAFRSER